MSFASIYKYLKSPRQFCINLLFRFSWMFRNDESYLKLLYFVSIGHPVNLKHPKSFNEKLNWLKLNYSNSKMRVLADKYASKNYVSELIGSQYVVPLLGVWDSVSDIDYASLPNSFILKTTHDSGGTIVCRDKSYFDKDKAAAFLNRHLSTDFFMYGREPGYKDITRRIIAEEFLPNPSGDVLTDYKFWCFNGIPKYMYITVKNDSIFENFYDMDFNPVNINHGFRRFSPEFSKPLRFDEMKSLAERLSSGFPFVRVDFFYVEDKVYFSEMTFFDWGGLRPFADINMDIKLGKLIELS